MERDVAAPRALPRTRCRRSRSAQPDVSDGIAGHHDQRQFARALTHHRSPTGNRRGGWHATAVSAAARAASTGAARPALPATPAPATGQNSPQFQAALELNRRAAILESVPDKTGVNQRQAAALRAQAQLLYMQADSVVQTPQGQVHTLTGKIDDPAKPLPHYVYDPNMGFSG